VTTLVCDSLDTKNMHYKSPNIAQVKVKTLNTAKNIAGNKPGSRFHSLHNQINRLR